ncbi:MAG: hypothetical protein ACYTGW_01270 [Planctomycetota bacterium]|jgi:uncharacterized membrane protein YphA (DoxX/SURF4 family)
MVIIGGVLFLFGLVDLIGSFADFDLWGSMGVELPEFLWKFSAWIEIIIGALLFKLGKRAKADDSP